ncbi:regulator of microtubule dynamics protein 1-like [Ostrinia furnacalis]|uniref:regulator of microtubule dynamics protein 1-like n=1 Tax=Ostrinia furnacalis TaxID=93504 RepID=UPI0010403E23|nr:regulator of microtubule dynamics protein 1-like [Ostrinia furnacalis]
MTPLVVKFHMRKMIHLGVCFRIVNNIIKHSKTYSQRKINPEMFMLSGLAGLAFMWPTKKLNKESLKTNAETVTSVLEHADNLFENGHYEECYNLLSSTKEQNVEINWRICRVLYNMSKEPKYDKKYKKDLVFQAYNIICDELSRHQDNFAVQKWYALLLDAKCSYDGIKERIKQLENIKKHMDLAVTLNPNDATTLHMLGEWCYQVSSLPWHQRKIAEALFASPPQSTYEDALEYFLRAEAAQPRFYSLNLLRLGNCYLKLQKEDQAKYYLKLAASYPAKSNDDHYANKEATELLNKIK